MRRAILSLALLGLSHGAVAADLDDTFIRGSDVYAPQPAAYTRWDGFYAGGQVGASTAHFDFSQTTQPVVGFLLRNTTLDTGFEVSQIPVLQTQDTTAAQFGAFLGYSTQLDSVVLSLEGLYSQTGINGSQTSSVTRLFTPGDGNSYVTTVTGQAGYRINDYGELRARAGYVVGNFLPYATLGVALARANIMTAANVTSLVTNLSGNIPPYTVSQTQGEAKQAYVFGYTAGVGVDVLLFNNIFLRGEYEFMLLLPVSNMQASVNTLRLGGGVRF